MNKGLYVVMGVSGSGKTVIGLAFARSLGVEFVEGDDFHPEENLKRMASGIALTDEDRAPWLRSIGARLRAAKEAGTGLVVSCSALKRSYRDLLRAEAGDVRFMFLKGSRALIAERLATRSRHFMPPSLLDSQFAALEEPGPDERVWECDVRESPADLVAALAARAST
jgi:carbohydrate kinase (thermoresistant glucokinase family)